jgi:hypothetical protein
MTRQTRLIYLGPPSSVALRGIGDVQLSPGQDCALPPDHPYTRRLLARRLLRIEPVTSDDMTSTQGDGAADGTPGAASICLNLEQPAGSPQHWRQETAQPATAQNELVESKSNDEARRESGRKGSRRQRAASNQEES